MTNRDRIIQAATAEVGTKEFPPNSNKQKYGVWYGMDGVYWCAIFVSWVFYRAGLALGHVDSDKGYHYVPSAINFWKKTHQTTTNPEKGDIVCFDWERDGKADHTCIFESWLVKGASFNTIEGNTSPANDSNGGEVMKRVRNIGSVACFVKPNVLIDCLPMKAGDKGEWVKRAQYYLLDKGFHIFPDGDFGTGETEPTVRKFQLLKGIPSTGIIDELTLNTLIKQ